MVRVFSRIGSPMTIHRLGACTAISLASLSGAACASVQPDPLFSDGAVLQRDHEIPIWGTAAAGEKVVVRLRDQERTTTADAQGHWRVELGTLAAGGPDILTIAGDDTRTIKDVLVGEVWIGSGQSNMVVGAEGVSKQDEEMARIIAADHPQVRIHPPGRTEWKAATAAIAPHLPALPLAFAVRLQQELGVPVGVIVRAMPGTSTDFWVSREAIHDDQACQTAIAAYASTVYPELKRKYDGELARGAKDAKVPAEPGEPGMGKERLGKHYDAQIKPLMPYAIRGVLWDQGENATSIAGVSQYQAMGALFRGWRKDWGQGEFPFVYTEKPSGGGCAWDPGDPVTSKASPFSALPDTVNLNGGAYRYTYVRLMDFPKVAMTISTDLGSGTHPLGKSAYGTRAARVALSTVYGRTAEWCGPLYHAHAVEGGRIRLSFTHVGKGLACKHADKLQGFSIAGQDRKFVWADAVIDGETVVVSSPGVAAPVAVRYAWATPDISWANLFNQDGLPAQTFRTDDWDR
jgi:sialate O-acetylesterase